MNKITLIIPYFGSLPPIFPLFFKSCEKNRDIDFLFVTDLIDATKAAENIHVLNISFNELFDKIQSIFDFKISLDRPYKLCDYKPLYGEIFKEELQDSEYWGYCDTDIIFGDIGKFLREINYKNYDRLYDRGHFSLYRNTKEICQLYQKCPEYKKVFSTEEICIFDESPYRGINKACKDYNLRFYENRNEIFDCIIKKFNFCNVNWDKASIFIFHYKGKSLYAIDNKSKESKEIMYAHFQKRKMRFMTEEIDDMYICNNTFLNEELFNQEKNKYKKNFFYGLGYYKYRLKNAFSKRLIRVKEFIRKGCK